MFFSWIGRSNRSSRARHSATPQNHVRLKVEELEDRRVLSTASNAYVNAVYQGVLHRQADPQGLAFWSSLLDSGQQNRTQIAQDIQNSVEGQNVLINSLYQQALGRNADPGGLVYWRSVLNANNNGDNDDHDNNNDNDHEDNNEDNNGNQLSAGLGAVAAGLFGSQEFYSDAGGTTNGFVNLLYQRGLGRTADASGLATFTTALNGGASRNAVALAVLTSQEAETNEVNNFYKGILGRTGEQAGVNYWTQVMQSGTSPTSVQTSFLASPEFYANVVTGTNGSTFTPDATIDTRALTTAGLTGGGLTTTGGASTTGGVSTTGM